MTTERKRRINAISHFVWAGLALIYFIIILLVGRGGGLQPDSLKDTLGESISYAICLVIFFIFYAVGCGIGAAEGIIHGVVYLLDVPAPTDVAIWKYASLFLKAAVLANCTFLSVMMGKQLIPGATGAALAYILPLSFLGLLQILLFLMDLWIAKDGGSSFGADNFT